MPPTCRSLIVAMAENRVIGRQGTLPWRLSADLKRFRKITLGHHLIMGRKTYESIGRPLPGRVSIVVTRRDDYHPPGCRVAHDIESAFALAGDDPEPFVIGGGELYRAALRCVDRIYLTLVHSHVEGDTYFPELDWQQWRLVSDEQHAADASNEYDHSFRIYERIGGMSAEK